MSGLDLSVVVPAYCEEQRLPAGLRRIREWLAAWPGRAEIIVVDDGSSDRTSAVATAELAGFPAATVLRNEPNAGKGASVRRGMLSARGAIALFTDADLSTPIEEFAKLQAAHTAGADIAIGSRALAASQIEVHQPLARELAGRCFNLFIRTFVMGGIRDTQCGFKSFRREVLPAVFGRQQIERWGFDVEVLYIARRLGYQIAEVPVVWRNDEATKVNAAADGLKMLREALQARRMHRHLTPGDRDGRLD
ncbi:MAG: glycosyltransferase family 2 protein [Fimbriimonadaceae bacterium]|nr:glycosyltransferase family 2 protein [Fimbriimonadaceae bacterium]